MKNIAKRILAYLCTFSLLFTGWGDMLPYGLAGQVAAAPVVFTKELTASDGRTYEITVSFDVEEEVEGETHSFVNDEETEEGRKKLAYEEGDTHHGGCGTC